MLTVQISIIIILILFNEVCLTKNIFRIFIIFLIFIFDVRCSNAENSFAAGDIFVAASFQPAVDRLEEKFRQKIEVNEGIIFSKVPRGLVISFDEKIFFNEGESRIKENSLYILDALAVELGKISNDCVIENHTDDLANINEEYNYQWEMSLARASNISQYLICCGNIDSKRLFSLGYGEFMPFRDNVSSQNGMDKRIDFVILEYEAKR